MQDELITIRGDRFVIPVKTEQRRRVQGVAHGASSSGQTVFIEPLETIEQNNELVRLLDEEQAEIHRILLEMTARIGEHADALEAAVDVLAELELQFAKARFAQDYDCVRSEAAGETDDEARQALTRWFCAMRGIRCSSATLKPKGVAVVPLTVEIDSAASPGHHQRPQHRRQDRRAEDHRTAGTDGAVGNSRCRPSAPSCRSSTASSPISATTSRSSRTSRRFRRTSPTSISSRITRPRASLVLLDELGSATDPEEGAALAVSIADFFRRAGCLSIVSTHHTALKVYAANTEGVLNAAVGFDERTLAPTYELRMGVPGASAGINIAQQLGLNPQIVATAREQLTSQTQDVSRFLDRLHSAIARARH